MKYVVDRIEGEFAVCENLDTCEMINIELSKLPEVSDGDIIIYQDGKYIKSEADKKERLDAIKEKMARLKGE